MSTENTQQLDQLKIDPDTRYNTKNSSTKQPVEKRKKKRSKSFLPSFLMLFVLISGGFFALDSLKQMPYVHTAIQSMKKNKNSYFMQQGGYKDIEHSVAISNVTTQSVGNEDNLAIERMVIPGEVADEIAQQIANFDTTDGNAQITFINEYDNELPLNKELPDGHFTLELFNSDSLNDLFDVIKSHNLTNYQMYEIQHADKPVFALIRGNYLTYANAEEAIIQLPEALKTPSVKIKSANDIKQDKAK